MEFIILCSQLNCIRVLYVQRLDKCTNIGLVWRSYDLKTCNYDLNKEVIRIVNFLGFVYDTYV